MIKMVENAKINNKISEFKEGVVFGKNAQKYKNYSYFTDNWVH